MPNRPSLAQHRPPKWRAWAVRLRRPSGAAKAAPNLRATANTAVLVAGAVSALIFVGTLFIAIARAQGSQVILSKWSLVLAATTLVLLGWMAVLRES